jgi:3-isopropylmalate/(R)-2-methylmalate dehydratase small subunit
MHMEAFTRHTGVTVPLDRANVDTDQIIPKQFLKRIERTGFGVHLFHDWRYLDADGTEENPEFVLNREPFRRGSILLARENFGCGSSREHALWALHDFGIRAIVAPSFAEIFRNNCFQNGIVPVSLSREEVDEVFMHVMGEIGSCVTVDLQDCMLLLSNGKSFRFEVDAFRRECLLNGWDDIDLTLRHEKEIIAFERKNSPLLVGKTEA